MTLAPGDYDLATLLRASRTDVLEREPITPDDPAVLLMSGGTTGTPKGRPRHARRVRHGRAAGAGVGSIGAHEPPRRHPPPVAAVPRVRQRRRPGAGARQRQSDGDRAEPARSGRSHRDDPPREADVLQRRADALHRAPEPSRRQRAEGRFQVDQDLLLRRGAAAGRHETAVRIAHRRAHRRRLFADRGDDGALRQPGERPEQDRIGRHAAPRRRRPHLRRRRRNAARCRPARSARSRSRRRS